MNLLAINTSAIEADLALLAGNKKIFKKFDSNLRHSESVMPGIDEVLSEACLKVEDLDGIAIVVGPGSFTGIRIGISIVKGFETVFPSLKKIDINSLELMSMEFLKAINSNKLKTKEINEFVCVINALSEKFFLQKFNSSFEKLGEPQLCEQNEVKKNKNIICLKNDNLEFATVNVSFSPQTLLEMSIKKFEMGEFVTDIKPLYLRNSQAEESLKLCSKSN